MNWENSRTREGPSAAASRASSVVSPAWIAGDPPVEDLANVAVGSADKEKCTPLSAAGADTFWAALAWSLVAAVGYTAANVCLRSVTNQPPEWVSCIKAVPTLLMVLPWTALRLVAGRGVMSGWSDVGILIVAALIGQLVGNVAFQWSLGIVGLALAVPLTLGSLIVNGALLGHYVLHDRMTRATLLAGAVLLAAIMVLSLGADSAHLAVAGPSTGDVSAWQTTLGVLAACGSGFAYSCLGLAIRYTGRHGMPMPSTLLIASLTGTVSLALLTSLMEGSIPIALTPRSDWAAMIGAGGFNAIAFLAFTKALHTGSLFFVNAVNTTQTTMAAVMGILVFHEPPTVWLVVGLVLTVAGLMLMGRRQNPQKQ